MCHEKLSALHKKSRESLHEGKQQHTWAWLTLESQPAVTYIKLKKKLINWSFDRLVLVSFWRKTAELKANLQ